MSIKKTVRGEGKCSTMRVVNEHKTNTQAYDLKDSRICKLDKQRPEDKDELRNYHFCSPDFTDHKKGVNIVDLEYIGTGKIHSIKNIEYMGGDRNQLMHFWKIAGTNFEFLNFKNNETKTVSNS